MRGYRPIACVPAIDAMARAFDAALAAGAGDIAAGISADARPVAVGGSRDLIDRGLHREAMYWIAVTWARCVTLLRGARPGRVDESNGRGVLGDIGIASIADARGRAESALAYLPAVEALAVEIIEARG